MTSRDRYVVKESDREVLKKQIDYCRSEFIRWLQSAMRNVYQYRDGYAFLGLIENRDEVLRVLQADLFIYREGEEPTDGVLRIEKLRREMLSFADWGAYWYHPEGRFEKALVVARYSKKENILNSGILYDEELEGLEVNPDTWWDVAKRVDPLARSVGERP